MVASRRLISRLSWTSVVNFSSHHPFTDKTDHSNLNRFRKALPGDEFKCNYIKKFHLWDIELHPGA
jgi:hypothetical protein